MSGCCHVFFAAAEASDYHEIVFVLSRRLVEGVFLLFALLGFVFVPLGEKTGFEHAVAVARTAAAAEALHELWLGGDRLRRKLVEALEKRPFGQRSFPSDAGSDEALELERR